MDMAMFSEQYREIIELLANIAAIFGFAIGLFYVGKIYNNIVNVKVDKVTINNYNYALPEKDFVGKVYENKKVGEFKLLNL